MKNNSKYLIVGIFAGYITLLGILYKMNRDLVLPVALFLSFFGLISIFILKSEKKN